MEKQTLLFQIERETKNTVRYQEVVPDTSGGYKILDMTDAVIGTLYIKKKISGGHIPERIIVEVYPSND